MYIKLLTRGKSLVLKIEINLKDKCSLFSSVYLSVINKNVYIGVRS